MENQPPPPPQETPPPAVSAPPANTGLSADDKNLGMVTHLTTFFAPIVGPLVIYLIKKDSSAFVRHHATEALNFQISIIIYAILSAFLVFLFIGIPLLLAVVIIDLIFTIIATIRANEGAYYRYPLSIRLIN